jgi:hypothetical protein
MLLVSSTGFVRLSLFIATSAIFMLSLSRRKRRRYVLEITVVELHSPQTLPLLVVIFSPNHVGRSSCFTYLVP